MQVFRLAGRFRLPGCARACVQALQALDPGRLTEQEVLEVMQLPADQGFKLGPGADTPMGLALGLLPQWPSCTRCVLGRSFYSCFCACTLTCFASMEHAKPT